MSIGVRSRWVVVILGLCAAALASAASARRLDPGLSSSWQSLASPGRLSAAHASLERDCAACHTPVKGPDASKCIACHANEEALLQRQPTAFHAQVGSCRECHVEHRGVNQHPTAMDHAALAGLGLRPSGRDDGPVPEEERLRKELISWIGRGDPGGRRPYDHPGVTRREAALDCAACHGTKDRHLGYFGNDCAECHGTAAWTIPEFRHPSPSSTECVQCHRAPPCHFMPSFFTACAKLAGKPGARVEQCFSCHQTTSWNDIKGVGICMHH